MKKHILITGSSGYLGTKAIHILNERNDFAIFGLDLKRPADLSMYEGFFHDSVTDEARMQNAFASCRPEIAVHLAFLVGTVRDRKAEEAVDVGGTRNFLNCCARFGVKKMVLLSSAAAYGAHDDNDLPLTELSDVRGNRGYGYSHFKAVVDRMARQFLREHDACQTTILRPCLFIGKNTRNDFFDILKYPVVPVIRDRNGLRDPRFQFLHEDDMAECLVAAIEKQVGGIFNVAGGGEERYSELIRRFGKRSLAVPASLLYPVAALLWRLHLSRQVPAQLDFIRFPWTMDTTKMHEQLYKPRWSTSEAFDAFVAAQRGDSPS